MSYEYSENILVQESAAALLHDELGWDVVTAYNQETLGENGQVLTEHFTVCSDGALLTVTLRAQCLERIDRDLPLPP